MSKDKTWEGRGDVLSDKRLTIFAGRSADDTRLSGLHLRMLAHLGRQNNTRGWLRLSQKELAEQWGVTRQRVNMAVRDLVDWGYVFKRDQKRTGESYCTYKVRLDEPGDDEGGVSRTGDTPKGGGVSRTGDTGVTSGDTPLSPTGDTPHYIPARAPTTTDRHRQETPHTPSTGAVCVSGSGKRSLIDDLEASTDHPHVVEHLIRPLWGALTFGPGQDPEPLLRAIVDELAEFSDPALAEAARTLRGTRSQWPSPAKAREAAQSAQARHMVRIVPGTTAWSAWVTHWHQSGSGFLARHYEAQGHAMVPREFPPVRSAPDAQDARRSA